MERLTNAAYDLNSATRFARMDVALDLVAADARAEFMRRHASWHGDVRIVDVELQGVRLITAESAEVQIAVGWHRIDDTSMRSSLLAQMWIQGKSGWELSEEARVAGAPGIFAPVLAQRAPRARAARQAPTMDGLTISDWQ